jgi:hypothetical protein
MTNEGWQTHTLLPWKRVKLIDGSEQRGGLIMRRKANGVWQYRLPTLDEAYADWVSFQW